MNNIFFREFILTFKKLFNWLNLIIFPCLILIIFLLIFIEKNPKNLPLGVIDNDNSRLSQKIIRTLDSTSVIKTLEYENIQEANEALLKVEVYGLFVIGYNYEKNVHKNTPIPLVLATNSQYILPSNLITKAVSESIGALNAEIKTKIQLSKKYFPPVISPIHIDSRALFNPTFDYSAFLLPSVLFMVLHILIIISGCNAVGEDYKENKIFTWEKPTQILLTKGLIQISIFTIWGIIYFYTTTVNYNNLWLMILSIFLLVSAYWFLGSALVLLTRSLREGAGYSSFVTSPAFAFSGVTFPIYAMPPFAQFWAELLPMTHFVKILIDQSTRNAPFFISLPYVGILFFYSILYLFLSIILLKNKIKHATPYIY